MKVGCTTGRGPGMQDWLMEDCRHCMVDAASILTPRKLSKTTDVRSEVEDEGLENRGWMVNCARRMYIMGCISCISIGKHLGVTSTNSAPGTSKAGERICERKADVRLRSGMKDWKKHTLVQCQLIVHLVHQNIKLENGCWVEVGDKGLEKKTYMIRW